MRTVTNISNVSDYSGETPISTPSNEVMTVINDPAPACCICCDCCEVPCCCRKCCDRCCCCDYCGNERRS